MESTSLWFALTLAAYAQSESTSTTPKFTTRANLVSLPTRVETKKGDIIYGLRPDQFVVEDNGVRQSVKIDEAPDSTGLSLVLVVQCGRDASAEFPKLQGLATMLEAIAAPGAPSSEVAVVSFGEGQYVLDDFSPAKDSARSALSKLKPCGEFHAATIDAVYFAINMLKKRPNHNRRAILLISETRDHGSRSKLNEVILELGVTDTAIYSLAFAPAKNEFLNGLGHRSTPDKPEEEPRALPTIGQAHAPPPESDPVYLDHGPSFGWPSQFLLVANALRRNTAKELAVLSAGEHFSFSSQKGLEEALGRISNQIRNEYLLSFQPPPGPIATLHTITVRVPDYPKAAIFTRKSYWSGIYDSSSVREPRR